MNPATIIKQAQAEGVNLTLSSTGTIKASGEEQAVTRWLPTIREHKAALLDELRAANEGAYDVLSDSPAEARRRQVLRMLAESPRIRYAVVTDTEGDLNHVIVAIAIRDKGTCELEIPRPKWDGVTFLEILDKHAGTLQS